jgi:hypothetical protein
LRSNHGAIIVHVEPLPVRGLRTNG